MWKKTVSARRLLHTCATFSQSLMVSVGILKLGCIQLIFVDPGAKINGQYYKDVLLAKLLSAIRRVWGFRKHVRVPARQCWDTIELLHHNTPDFIAPDMWPPNSPDLNPVDYVIWWVMQERVYQTRVHDIDELRQCLITVWCWTGTAYCGWRRRLLACVFIYLFIIMNKHITTNAWLNSQKNSTCEENILEHKQKNEYRHI